MPVFREESQLIRKDCQSGTCYQYRFLFLIIIPVVFGFFNQTFKTKKYAVFECNPQSNSYPAVSTVLTMFLIWLNFDLALMTNGQFSHSCFPFIGQGCRRTFHSCIGCSYYLVDRTCLSSGSFVEYCNGYVQHSLLSLFPRLPFGNYPFHQAPVSLAQIVSSFTLYNISYSLIL